jgi:putative copper resistance protein D
VDELVILSRLVHFAAVSLLFGGVLFRLCIQPRKPDRDDPLPRVVEGTAGLLALVSMLGWFIGVGASMAGDWSELLAPDTLASLILDTRFGRLWIARFALLAAIIALTLAGRRRTRIREVALLVLCGAFVASLAGVGHGSVGAGWFGLAHLASDMIHLLCAATWLGGLVCLGVVLRRAATGGEAGSVDAVRTLLPRFSRVGYLAVAVLLMTGCFNAIVLLARPDALIGTSYGQVLLLKVGLVAVMVAFAIGNRLWLSPRIVALRTPNHSRGPIPALYRSVAMEQGVGLLVLATTAVLGTIHPVP